MHNYVDFIKDLIISLSLSLSVLLFMQVTFRKKTIQMLASENPSAQNQERIDSTPFIQLAVWILGNEEETHLKFLPASGLNENINYAYNSIPI